MPPAVYTDMILSGGREVLREAVDLGEDSTRAGTRKKLGGRPAILVGRGIILKRRPKMVTLLRGFGGRLRGLAGVKAIRAGKTRPEKVTQSLLPAR